MRWKDQSTSFASSTFPLSVLEFCCYELLPLIHFQPDKERCITGFTEHQRTDNVDQFIFRTHPSYKSSSKSKPKPWFDWAIVMFDEDLELPCQLMCFIHLQNLVNPIHQINGVSLDGDGDYAIVRCFKNPPADIRESHFAEEQPYCVIIEWGTLEDGFFVVPVDSIVRPVAVVPNIPMSTSSHICSKDQFRVDPKHGYFVVHNQEEWAYTFSALLESCYYESTPE
jgi:hypothetical protein